jgi:hypothetical protein
MRSGQHNSKRSRSRSRRHTSGGGGGNNSGGNPINRVYESNGPDVKVRGTAQTIADKYLQLGRDAQSSGDIVMAESYYQFAEHYLRLLSAAQAYLQQTQPQQYRNPRDEFSDEDMEDGFEGDGDGQAGERQPFAGEQADVQSESAEAPRDGERQGNQPANQQGNQQQNSRYRDQNYQRDRGRDQNRDYRSDSHRDQTYNQGQNRDQNRNDRNRYGRGDQPRYTPRPEENQLRVESEAPAPVQAAEPVPAPQPPPREEGWDGPQPSFLKKPAPVNGAVTPPRGRGRPKKAVEEAVGEPIPEPGQAE